MKGQGVGVITSGIGMPYDAKFTQARIRDVLRKRVEGILRLGS
ncbi:hypothetical protein ACTXKF_14680 [Vreelandella alkaliphila]